MSGVPGLVLLSACRMVVDYGAEPDGPSDTGTPTPDTADPTSPPTTPPTPPTTTTPVPRPVGVIGEPGDAISEGGLWWVPPGGTAGLRLAVGIPSRGSVALFDADALEPETPVADAAAELLGDEGKAGWAFAVADQALVMGVPGEEEVWLLARDPVGRVDGEEQALAVAELDDDGPKTPDTEFGAAVAVGDADGDGIDDLAIGDPRGDAGSGTVVRGGIDTIFVAGSWSSTDAPMRVRGAGDRFGAAIALGPVDGSGVDALVACAPGSGDGVCWVVPGGVDVADLDVSTVASASVAADGLGRVPPRIGDVDGDGAAELILAGDGATWIFADPAGTLDPSAAVAVIDGDVGAVGLVAGGVILGAPGDDAVYRIDAPSGTLPLPAGADAALTGTAASSFGAAVSDVADGRSPGMAVGAPDARSGAGEVLLLDLPAP